MTLQKELAYQHNRAWLSCRIHYKSQAKFKYLLTLCRLILGSSEEHNFYECLFLLKMNGYFIFKIIFICTYYIRTTKPYYINKIIFLRGRVFPKVAIREPHEFGLKEVLKYSSFRTCSFSIQNATRCKISKHYLNQLVKIFRYTISIDLFSQKLKKIIQIYVSKITIRFAIVTLNSLSFLLY